MYRIQLYPIQHSLNKNIWLSSRRLIRTVYDWRINLPETYIPIDKFNLRLGSHDNFNFSEKLSSCDKYYKTEKNKNNKYLAVNYLRYQFDNIIIHKLARFNVLICNIMAEKNPKWYRYKSKTIRKDYKNSKRSEENLDVTSFSPSLNVVNSSKFLIDLNPSKVRIDLPEMQSFKSKSISKKSENTESQGLSDIEIVDLDSTLNCTSSGRRNDLESSDDDIIFDGVKSFAQASTSRSVKRSKEIGSCHISKNKPLLSPLNQSFGKVHKSSYHTVAQDSVKPKSTKKKYKKRLDSDESIDMTDTSKFKTKSSLNQNKKLKPHKVMDIPDFDFMKCGKIQSNLHKDSNKKFNILQNTCDYTEKTRSNIKHHKRKSEYQENVQILKGVDIAIKMNSNTFRDSELEEGEILSSESEDNNYFSINDDECKSSAISKDFSSSSSVQDLDDWIDTELEKPVNCVKTSKNPGEATSKSVKSKRVREFLLNKSMCPKNPNPNNKSVGPAKKLSNAQNPMCLDDSDVCIIESNENNIVDEIIDIAANKLESTDRDKNEIECIDMENEDYNDPVLNSKTDEINNISNADSINDFEMPSNNGDDDDDADKMYEILNSDKESVSSCVSSELNFIESNDTNKDFVPLTPIDISELNKQTYKISNDVLRKQKQLKHMRKWETINYGRKYKKSSSSTDNILKFTVMSYNVLAQKLLTDNMYLYKECESDHLEWDYRWPLLQYEISDIDPDIITLQEVQATHYHTHYHPWFTNLGYECLYKKRTGSRADGCAIVFKSKKFRLLEHSTIEYLQPKAPRVLDRDNVGLIAKLIPIQGQESPICIATTHLLYNPKRHDVKLAQTTLFFTELDRLCYERECGGRPIYCPTIITGDMNAEPHTSLIDFYKSGFLNYKGLDRKTLTQNFRGGDCLGLEIIPSSLGVSETCQHQVLSNGRYLEKMRGSIFSLSDKRKLEQDLIQIQNSEWENSFNSSSISSSSHKVNMRGSGCLRHNFSLKSVYRHFVSRKRNAAEVTADQNGWCTVDYMFYSKMDKSNRELEQRSLRLISRYGLLTADEARIFAPMPSSVCPSDHFPLAAQFILT